MEVFSVEAKEYIFDRVQELEGSWEYKANELRSEVKEKFGNVIANGEALRKLCGRIRELRTNIEELNESIPQDKKYDIVDGSYIIETKRGIVRLTVEQADELFKAFSRHGENLSGEEMRIKFQMKPWAWQAVKNALGLYKDSHTISPHSIDSKPEEEQEKIIEDAVGAHIDGIKRKMVVTHDKKFKEEAKKAIGKLANVDYFLEHLEQYLVNYKPEKTVLPAYEPKNSLTRNIIFSDIHIGKNGTADIIKRLAEIRDEAISAPEDHIYLTCLGDLVETLVIGGMHPGQYEYGMEGRYGFDLMMDAVHALEAMLLDIAKHKKVYFTGLSGNHDRLTKDKDYDKQYTGGLVIYEMIRRGIAGANIEFNIARERITTIDMGKVRFIVNHGDGNFQKQKPEQIIVSHGMIGGGWYNVLLSGDKHHVEMNEGKNYTVAMVPALAGQGTYDKELNLHSEPGCIVVIPNKHSTVDIILKRL